MEKSMNENNIFKIKLLRNILIVSLSIVTLLSLYNVFFIYPSFTDLLIDSTKDDAIRATRHLASTVIADRAELTKDSFNLDSKIEIQKIKNDFELMKLKVFSNSGTTLFSTDPKDIGHLNKEKYFQEIVAKGKVHTEIVPKDSESLEGWKVTADVLETYVPLVRNDLFMGAFEIYYDITARKNQLDNLLTHSTTILLALAVCLIVAFIVIFFKESKTTAEQKRAEEALRESEEKLAGILNSIPDMIIVLDKNMNISWSNPIADEWLGLNPVGKKCFEAFDLGDQQCEACDVQKCFEKGLNDEHELELVKPDGSRMNLWCTASVATWSEGGVPKSVIVVYRDITEKKLLQAETARAGQLASIGELAAGVAHEINNPINGIINCAQMLMDEDGATTERTEITKRIMKAGNRIAMIVHNLLSFARNNEEEAHLVHVQSILSDSLDLTEVQIRKDGIDLSVDIPQDIPMLKVRGHQIQQVFLNIISNARYALNQKYSQTHENKVIEIKGDTIDANGKQYVRVIFFDRGTGIPDDILGKICDPFFSNKPLGEGTGLGLSISQAIIKDHGGDLYFDSVEGEYTSVI
ncbi:MAG: histidine kinase dimerization/phospho-acceptor domain-containing protein, partial [Desulfobacterales bacterium]